MEQINRGRRRRARAEASSAPKAATASLDNHRFIDVPGFPHTGSRPGRYPRFRRRIPPLDRDASSAVSPYCMYTPQSRILAWRWPLTGFCVLLITLCLWSVWYMGFFSWRTGHGSYTLAIADGLVVLWPRPVALPADGPRFQYEIEPAIGDGVGSPHDTVIPIFLLIPVALVPTIMLWRRRLRRPPPGFCRRCKYDLTANTSGRCPECGEPIARATANADRA